MHGRLKLRPPDAARRRQREEKLRHYRESMDALLGVLGVPPAQVLSLTGSVLAANPDVGTCWNLRRRALAALGGDWVPSELSFVGQCLGVNPKSYGAWHHRGWVLAQGRAPPAGREDLALCERLLAADPRNCELYWFILVCTGMDWDGVLRVLGVTGLYWDRAGVTGLYWFVLGEGIGAVCERPLQAGRTWWLSVSDTGLHWFVLGWGSWGHWFGLGWGPEGSGGHWFVLG
ncbi:geranylgeranyl transferase type-2 subunit alpha [Geothlypis trichas]